MIRFFRCCRFACLAAALLVCSSQTLTAAFVIPSASDARFGWNFGDPNSVGAGWDVFSNPYL